ncbi:MAG: hypothetical protein ACRC06_10250 [Waterburya sp.]
MTILFVLMIEQKAEGRRFTPIRVQALRFGGQRAEGFEGFEGMKLI